VVFGIIHTVLNPDARANEHTQQGNAYRALQADARVFRTVDFDLMTDEERRGRLAELMQQRTTLNARNRPGWLAFKIAQRKIERSHDLEDDTE
jgi:hypothetical protein